MSSNKYNKRFRSAILIISKEAKILVDFGPDIKHQLTLHQIENLDAIICTHRHADHVAGIDDLKPFGFDKKQIDLYSDKSTLSYLKKNYSYIFKGTERLNSLFNPIEVGFYDKIKIKDLEIQFFKQNHYSLPTLGIRIEDFVYSIDVKNFPKKSLLYLKNIKNWIVDCIDYEGTDPHMGLNEVIELKNIVDPQNIFLTNLSHNIEYEEISKILPSNIKACYDDLVILCL